MKRIVALLVATVVLWANAGLYAQIYWENASDSDLVDSLAINNGDYYSYVDADETSVIDIFGGTVDELVTFAISSADISGGLIENLDALHFSTINVSGGEVSDLSAYDQSSVNVTGGAVDWLYVSFNSETTVTGGQVDKVWADSSSTVSIFGYDLEYEPFYQYDGTRQEWEGLLTGYWENEVSFDISTWDQGTYEQMVLYDLGPLPSAPEPATLLLLGLGALSLRKKK
ncbi:MAG: PEP-CTERM sorting domain-containing protein [Planctomycetota bacterium]|jgi:hypothetical protein